MYCIETTFKDGGLLRLILPKKTDSSQYSYRDWCVSMFEGKKYLPLFCTCREIVSHQLGFFMDGRLFPIFGDAPETEKTRNLQRELAYFRQNKWEVKVDTVKLENGGEIRVIQRKGIEG